MSEPPFIALQRTFARHLRNPDRYPAPPLPEARLAVYRSAVFMNVERFMRDNFPRVAEALAPDAWTALVRDYLARHRSDTPLFVELLQEFLDYLAHEREAGDDPPWLFEVAHFDWLENAIATDERVVPPRQTGTFDLLDPPLRLNPVHELVQYRFPVHAIGAEYRPQEPPPQPTWLLAFRDEDEDFGVLDLNAVAVQLFEGIRAGRTAREVLEDIASALGHPDPGQVLGGGRALLERWAARGLVLGHASEANPMA